MVSVFIDFNNAVGAMKLKVKSRLILIIPLGLLVVTAAMVWFGQYQRRNQEHYYSGTIEATRADLAFQTTGRVVEVLVDEGQSIKQRQVLARLEPETFASAVAQAEAALSQARANLNALKAALSLKQTMLPAEVSRAEAAVQAVEYQHRELSGGYRPQEVAKARLAVADTQAALEKARNDKRRADKLFEENVIPKSNKDTQDLLYENAMHQYQVSLENLKLAEEGFRKESIAASEAKVAESRATLLLARSNLIQIDVAEREIEAGRARVSAAEAALEATRIRFSYTELKAPFDGILTSRNVEPGEVVSLGREVLSVADLSRVKLKIFVDETEIGRVKTGQPVSVRIDTFADKRFKGRVSYISPESEFTPKIIQTHKERVKLVYLVKVALDNPNLELKPGMPADAWLH
jgi:HlyD family secretion protein